jgi:predicted nucleic acid-binding protein
MSHPRWRLVLDNTVISMLQLAGALSRILEFWPGRWLVPVEVRGEAARWRVHGASVLTILQALETANVIEITAIEPRIEGQLFAQLARRLGQGESAAIAIAFHRQLGVTLDGRQAQRSCDALSPPVPWISTEGILGQAVVDRFLTRSEAESIWQATGILDPNRGIP